MGGVFLEFSATKVLGRDSSNWLKKALNSLVKDISKIGYQQGRPLAPPAQQLGVMEQWDSKRLILKAANVLNALFLTLVGLPPFSS